MSVKHVVSQMIAYHHEANRRLWRLIEPLGDAVFCQESGYSIGSIRNHMVHLMSVDAGWLNGIRDNPRESFVWLNATDFPTISVTKAWAEQGMIDLGQQVERWSDDDLMQVPRGMSDIRWQILVHLTTHGVDHRSQVLPLIHAAGGETMPQDFMMHIWGWSHPRH
jgi:uncharacterized damage-inducible protein DinB